MRSPRKSALIAGVILCLGSPFGGASSAEKAVPSQQTSLFEVPLQPVVGYENFHNSAPNDAYELNVRAAHAMAKGDFDSALVALNQAIIYRPFVPQLYYDRALCEMSKAQWSKALTDLNLSLKLNPAETKNYFYSRADCRYHTHDVAGAMEDINRVIDRNPQFADAYQLRAFFRQAEGDQAGALADHTRAVALDPKFKGK